MDWCLDLGANVRATLFRVCLRSIHAVSPKVLDVIQKELRIHMLYTL
jgi:hypothetical protein